MDGVRCFLGGRLIIGTGADPIDDSVVVVEGDRIKFAGPRHQVELPAESEVHDVTGKTIIPGLIDCHDHLAHTGFNLMDRAASPLSLTMMRVAENLRITLESGVTSLRDAGGLDVGFKMAIEQGLIPGPRLMLGLTIISRTGGIDDPKQRSGTDLSWRNLPGLPSPVADGVEECRKRVREVLHAGADVVKCASTGGVSSPTLTAVDPTLTYQELKAIVEEARMLSKRTFVHAYGGAGLVNAVKAEIDSIEHGAHLCWHPEAIESMVDQGTYYVPTFMILALHREKGSPWAKRKASEMEEDHKRSLHMAMEAGVPIAMGTDAGAYIHGRNSMELRLMVEAGMSPMDAIVSSTKVAAECIELDKDVGTLEQGKFADLLVIDGDPLVDIAVLERRESLLLVMKGGDVYVDRLSSQIGEPASLKH